MRSSLFIRFPIARLYSAEVSLKKRACRRWRPSTRQLRFVNQIFMSSLYLCFYGQIEECTDTFTKDCYVKIVLDQPQEDCDLISRTSCTPVMRVAPYMTRSTTGRTEFYVFVLTIASSSGPVTQK